MHATCALPTYYEEKIHATPVSTPREFVLLTSVAPASNPSAYAAATLGGTPPKALAAARARDTVDIITDFWKIENSVKRISFNPTLPGI